LVVVVAPPWFVDGSSVERLKAQNEVRTTLLQGLAGIVLGLGAYFTYRQLHTAREQQITERYTRAIDQLGQDQLDVRLGGIYALERIARDSPADRNTIGEVLTSFVRSHAPWPPRLPHQYVASAPIDQVPELQVRAADVQASLTVLSRGGFAPPEREGDPWLDLTAVDLRRIYLRDAHLAKARLYLAHLEAASLVYAHLEEANLEDAHLEEARLASAHLEKASLHSAHLERAWLYSAHLEKAVLSNAHLEEASLADAHLEEAVLDGVHLEEAELSGAHLGKASLHSAHLEKANLMLAHLEKAILRSAHLGEAVLFHAQLHACRYPGTTGGFGSYSWSAMPGSAEPCTMVSAGL
jgi:uncharacterized protein YjbI with pentapeptide repeats